MKQLDFYNKFNLNTSNEVFDYLISTLKPSNTTFDYFVDWNKVFENISDIEIGLNMLNSLIGKNDFEFKEIFIKLIKTDPEIIKLIPIILVRGECSKKNIVNVLDYSDLKLIYKTFDFNKKVITNNDIDLYLEFIEKTGLKEIIQKEKIKNFVDYVIGVEAGLNSNARKNRSGTIMENIVESFIKQFCLSNNFEYITQANSDKILYMFNIKVPIYIDENGVKKERIYDFVIRTKTQIYLIECNFYGVGGSKLKSTAEEYEKLSQLLKLNRFNFIWITDGAGWLTTKIPLRKAYENIENLVNLQMIEDGVLHEIIK